MTQQQRQQCWEKKGKKRQYKAATDLMTAAKNDATAEDLITVEDQIFPSSCNKYKKNYDRDHQDHVFLGVFFSCFSTLSYCGDIFSV